MMNDWTDGYVADVGYTFGYYSELNPLRARLALLVAGLSVPQFETACELGFGQGVSINIHAAASTTEWHGTDFNPMQVGFARELSAASGARAKLFEEAFADFAHREDLPDYDFIGIHGIWSWISNENRAALTELIRRKLRVRGVLYISYNSLPGWATFAPIRHLMAEHANIIGAQGQGVLSRVTGAMDFVEKFMATSPTFSRANPQVSERFKRIRDQNPNYLVHEYFNGHWDPTYFATMVESLSPAKVNFACSAAFLDHYDAVNVTADQTTFLNALPDSDFRQTVRDFMINQQFRRDYWVKGPGRLSPLEQAEALRRVRVVLTTHRPSISLRITSNLGEATLHEEVYGPILDFLANHQVVTIGDIEDAVRARNVNFTQVVQATMVLVGAGHLSPAHDEPTIRRVRGQTDRLNSLFIQRARSSTDILFLASPVTGGGFTIGRFPQIFLLATKAGRKTPAELADFAWHLLASQGQKIIKEGKTLDTPDENVGELVNQANAFVEQLIPVLKALQIA